ncbi:glucose-specific phosphotransferase enzyme IIA component [Rodentibacter pneumotropicus]|uniref:Glucose-specific phosphotransferase enzyme IIA component n=1 Tax=Rodentibacter pneumotropicus TaxID=758 RepID=A0A3S4XUY7_9PAST|nr:glucose-specific phosphotransferase enzyme IIA component [Rodentibacter pneumotropicus]
MGLFDKLFGSKENKSVEVEIYAPLSGEIVNIEDVPDVVFSEKLLVMVLPFVQPAIRLSRLLMVLLVRFLKPTTLFQWNPKKALSYSFTLVSIPLN